MSDLAYQKLLKDYEELKVSQMQTQGQLQKVQDDNKFFRKELDEIKKSNAAVHNAVYLLEEEKVNLRKAVHKLKLRNTVTQRKMKKLREKLQGLVKDDDGASSDDELDYVDYDDIGRDFILVGGVNDPLSFGYKVLLIDDQEKEHKSAERYYWYLMAEYFNDHDAAVTIRTSPTYQGAETAMKDIKGYDDRKWDKVKLEFYKKAQTLKFEQARNVRGTLVTTGSSYIAVSSDDKLFGTGWRKVRDESMKPLTWDGQNEGGRLLMKIRKEAQKKHVWDSRQEQQDMENRVRDLRRNTWRRVDPAKRNNGFITNKNRSPRNNTIAAK